MSTLLRVAYEGSAFQGFARQRAGPKGPIPTVQGELERALADLYRTPVLTQGASRTDAGVHALGQLVAYQNPQAIPPAGVARALNARLPAQITIGAAWEESGADGLPVDVRRHNLGKHYRYRIDCTHAHNPLTQRLMWPLGRRLDPVAMHRAARSFAGTHDFGSFRASQCQSQHSIRTIEAVRVRWGQSSYGPREDRGRLDPRPQDGSEATAGPDWVEVDVYGQAFLYNMVRIMVGTLVEIGLGRRMASSIASLLDQPDRRRAGPTAPAHGLTLVEVRWPHSPK